METLQIRNYRCFGRDGVTIDITEGFTALIGLNNSGKSTLLRMLYEMREVWTKLQQHDQLAVLVTGRHIGIPFKGLKDPLEVFHNESEEPIELQFRFPVESSNAVSGVILKQGRESPGSWSGKILIGVNHKPLPAQRALHTPGSVRLMKEGTDLQTVNLREFLEKLKNAMYIGAFRNVLNQGEGQLYDLQIGTGFVSTWNEWKTGVNKQQNQRLQEATEDMRQLLGFDSLEINATSDGKTLNLMIDGKPFRLDEVGGGIAQFILVLGNAAIRQPSMIAIDEPELNLHPSLQLDFLTSIAKYTDTGRVWFATHSIGLARSSAEQILSVRRRENRTLIGDFEATPNYAAFLGELGFSAYQDLGFEKLLLVEGVHDVKVLQQWLRKKKAEHRVLILPLGGDQLASGTAEHELEQFGRISNQVYCLVDSEKGGKEESMTRARKRFAEKCRDLGYQCLVTEKRALENYLTQRAVDEVFPGRKALGPFQTPQELQWDKSNNWRVARAMEWGELELTDIGEFLNKISQPSATKA